MKIFPSICGVITSSSRPDIKDFMTPETKVWEKQYPEGHVQITNDRSFRYDHASACSDDEVFFLYIVFSQSADYVCQFCATKLPANLDTTVLPESKTVTTYDDLLTLLKNHELTFEQLLNLFNLDSVDILPTDE